MPTINILSQHVADLIAAGEVVERPASVIKELVENSFDAGARNVVVEIRDGGASYIRVTDDGCGMTPADAGIAFLRHATSKLSDEHGLEGIATFGFRGEALAAISAVCRMEILTRQKSSPLGTCVVVDAGELADISECGCPEGTSLICRDIFYNTPARLKFLKSDRSESSACISAAFKCALGRPDVSVRFIRDGAEEFFTPGDGRIESCLYALLGRDEASGMLECRSSFDNLEILGRVSSPRDGRGNRAHQFFFVNGRAIKSQLLQTALEQAYRNTLLTGRYPSCALYLTVPYGSVDVNVHPAKTEIRFGSEKAVFDFVYQSVKLALENESACEQSEPELKKADRPVEMPVYKQEFFEQAKMETFRQPAFEYAPVRPAVPSSPAASVPAASAAPAAPAATVADRPVYRLIGEAFKTYIIAELENGDILLIDKHAAHERMVFDRLKLQNREISSQLLLEPVTLHLSAKDSELLEANGSLLSDFGFEIEPFGENEYIIRGVPDDLDPAQARSAVEEILEKVSSGSAPDPASVRDSLLHTVACKSAIKAGWNTQSEELRKLTDAVVAGDIKYCPHGRPVSTVITRKDLDKLFKRIV